jgi:hypothetical protein
MAIGIVTNESSLALKVEVTEGTYVAPAAGTDYIEVLSDGLELNKTREELERNILSSTVEAEASRVGIADVQGSIGVELKASATQGSAPQSMDVLLRSLLGGKRQITSEQTSDNTTHTSTTIFFADTSDFAVGDIVLVKEAGAYECRPISAITANTSITFPFALDNGAPANSVVVAKTTTYYHDTANAITFSAEHNLGTGAIKQKAAGLRAASGSIENWTVGQLPTMSFAVQGLSLVREDANAAFSPNFAADGDVPVALSACAWLGGEKLQYTELSLSIENTISYIQSACSPDGRISSRITEQVVTASINPYMDNSDLTNTWDKFNDNDDVSLFFYAYNPTSTDGEFSEVVAGWLPQCKITASPVADVDGIVAEAIELKAFRNSGNDTVFLGFI